MPGNVGFQACAADRLIISVTARLDEEKKQPLSVASKQAPIAPRLALSISLAERGDPKPKVAPRQADGQHSAMFAVPPCT